MANVTISDIPNMIRLQHSMHLSMKICQFLHWNAKIRLNIFSPQVLIFLKKVDVDLIVVKAHKKQSSNKLRGGRGPTNNKYYISAICRNIKSNNRSHTVIIQILLVSWLEMMLFMVYYVWLFYYKQTHGRNAMKCYRWNMIV